jgi:esterase/lipase superfamily enzyme
LFFGFKVVQVDNIQRFGSAGRSWYESIQEFCFWMHGQFAKNGKDDSKVNLLTTDAFVDLSKFLCDSNEKPHHLVYVHGFNTSFDFAMEQAARLKADLKLTGNIFLFSWPSAGRISSYSSDEAAIEAAFPHFLRFMEVIQDAVSEEPLSVLAHSMGNRLLTRFIDRKSITGGGRKFNHAVFAAPDVDHDVFVHSLRSWNLALSRSTLYANSADVALQLSEIKHKFPRAGLIPPIANVQDLETILVQGFDLFDLAHGYFAQAGNTLHDIFVMLKFDASADERPGTRPVLMHSNASCWSISHF